MWKPYADEYGVSMYELTGHPPSKGRMMYMKQKAGYEMPQNELKYAPVAQKFKENEPKVIQHTSQAKDYYVNPHHMAEEDRPKRRTVSPSRPKVQSKELITGKRGSRAAEMFVRAREHTDKHVTDEEKVAKRKQARKFSPWEDQLREVTISVDETYEEPVPRKFQNVHSPRFPRKTQPQLQSQTRSIEQVDYSYSNGLQPRTTNQWKGDSERLKRFHREVEPYKMNHNRAPTGWGNTSECSDDTFDLGSLETQLPKPELQMFTTKTRKGRLRDFNARPKSWIQDFYEEEEVTVTPTTVRSRRVQFEEQAQTPVTVRNNKFEKKIRSVPGPKRWLPQSGDL